MLLDIEKGTYKIFPGIVDDGGGGREGGGGKTNFSVIPYRNGTFLHNLFLKTSKLPNKKGTFYVNLVFTATLPCTKRALFITKRHFLSFEKICS
jgi:hypothetical protein